MSAALRIVDSLRLDIDVEALTERRRAFDCVHLGMRDIPIGSLLQFLESEPGLTPPRTGHLGNWQEIAKGRSGAMDFNQPICARGYGYPLICCFTQTEANDRRGDWVYAPGSIVTHGRRDELPLYTWNGHDFVERDRDHALFCPFVLTRLDGKLTSLAQVHVARMRDLAGFSFALEPQLIMDRLETILPMLVAVIEDACRRENPARALSDIVSHAAAPAGEISRCSVRRDGLGFVVDGFRFRSVDAFVEALVIPFHATIHPAGLAGIAPGLPERVPVLSGLLMTVFGAIFATHFPRLPSGDLQRATFPFNPHLHWGARGMAGFPPRRRGYFMEKSTLKSLRTICSSLLAHFPDVAPMCVVLLPATVFMLCPSDAHPRDIELVSELLEDVNELREPGLESPTTLAQIVEETTYSWLARRRDGLSAYFRNRFRPHSGVIQTDAPAASTSVEPIGFRDLTFRRACMVVGALMGTSEVPSQ